MFLLSFSGSKQNQQDLLCAVAVPQSMRFIRGVVIASCIPYWLHRFLPVHWHQTMIIACQSLGSRPILVLELFTLVPCLFGTTCRSLSVQPVQLLPSRNIWRHISLIWPFPHRYRHSQWPVAVTELFPRFCCWTLIWLSRHWAWFCQGYWRYRSLIDWLIDWLEDFPFNKPYFIAARGILDTLLHTLCDIAPYVLNRWDCFCRHCPAAVFHSSSEGLIGRCSVPLRKLKENTTWSSEPRDRQRTRFTVCRVWHLFGDAFEKDVLIRDTDTDRNTNWTTSKDFMNSYPQPCNWVSYSRRSW